MMGMSEEMFWASNPRKLKPYGEYYFKKQLELDRISHRMGAYVFEAISVALNNAFSKKKVSYRDKPYMAEEEERRSLERMTKEERLARVEQIFEMLSSGHKQ